MSSSFESNGHSPSEVPRSSVDEHYAAFRSLFDYANQSWYLQKARGVYNGGKQTLHLENILSPIEERLAQASNVGLEYAAPLYADYVYPKTDYLFHKYVMPGVESSKQVLDKSKNVASTGGTLTLGFVVVATQASLLASVATTTLFLDAIILTKNTGVAAIGGAASLEKAIEARILSILENSRNMAKVPVDKFNDFSHSLLDIVNSILDNHLHLPIEEETEVTDNSNIGQRVTRLTRRVLYALKNRTNESLIQPAHNQLKSLTDQLQKSLHLVDVLRRQRPQLPSSVSELKTKLSPGQLSDSLNEAWKRTQAEANEYKILPSPTAQRLESAATYVEELNSALENSKDIYGVKDDVLHKAKQKLDEIVDWTSGLINRNNGGLETVPAVEPTQLNGALNHGDIYTSDSSHNTSSESYEF